MTTFYNFSLEHPGLEGVEFLIRKNGIPTNGDLESGFFDQIRNLRKHPTHISTGAVFADVIRQTEADVLLLIQNSDLVFDEGFLASLTHAIRTLPAPDRWSICGAAGLGIDGQTHTALYASDTPEIPEFRGRQPLIDVRPDLSAINIDFARRVLTDRQCHFSAGLELLLCLEGYLCGRSAWFLPELKASINGSYIRQDVDLITRDVVEHLEGRIQHDAIHSLARDIHLGKEGYDRDTGPTTALPDPHVPALSSKIGTAVNAVCSDLSISLIVRTRFSRDHLLRRLLTSISRARRDEDDLEIIISSDAERSLCIDCLDTLQSDFPNLTLVLQHNPILEPSRVENLLRGIRAASKEYIAVIDDDDYVDIFAFENIRTALFDGNRPVIAVNSEMHQEEWDETPSGRWVLSSSKAHGSYNADGWRQMFCGVNKLPICSLIIPREIFTRRLADFKFRHDLSEDFALFLLVLTSPELPAIAELDKTFCHISIRGTQNSVTMTDRRAWTRDIAGFLHDLSSNKSVAPAGLWQQLTHLAQTAYEAPHKIRDDRAVLEKAKRENALLRTENDALRAQYHALCERIS